MMSMKSFQRVFAGLAAAALLDATAIAQSPASQAPAPPQAAAQPQPTVQQQNEEILKELRAIRQLLERLTQAASGQAPQRARVENLKGYSLGKADAPLTMVEFTDIQCPYCRQFALTTFDQLKRDWIDRGMLRYISRDFPIDTSHAQAMNAARASRCAGEQGKFWEMRMSLMRNANLLTPDYIARTAADLKLDTAAFTPCAASNKYDADIRADFREGMQIGVSGTPTFVIGVSTPSAVEGPVLVGAMPYAEFDARLKDLLDTVKK
jgi:protein-disulfide isomerase